MIVVPDPLPLAMPPGDPGALDAVVSDVAGAGFSLTVLSRQLTGPAASAPGWLGADAEAAAVQVGVVASLAGESLRAVLAAMHALSGHAELLHVARRQVAALRREQEEDRSATWARLSRMDAHVLAVTSPPDAVAVVEEWRAGETSRQRRHAAVLEDVATDGARTARVLAECGAVAGHGGATGNPERVVAFLAARLPGWGETELAARGRALAGHLLEDLAEVEAAAEAALPLADAPVFATAVLQALGPEGVELLLSALGADSFGDSSALARVLAATLGAAVPGSDVTGTVGAVLAETYVRVGEHDGPSDVVAAGMAAVLVAAVPGTRGGLRLETVVGWSRQLLRRERAQGVYAGAGAVPTGWQPRTFDPAALALGILAARGRPAHAADLLADREAWDAVLAREWRDGGRSVDTLVWLAGQETGGAGRTAMRAGLEALGGELEQGDPDGWTVARPTAAIVAGSLAAGLAAHPTVVTDLLDVGAEGAIGDLEGGRLRGLAYLTIDRASAAVVERALLDWTTVHPTALEPGAGSVSITVPAGYLAVQEYGQRLAYTLLAHRLEQDAERREFLWNVTGHLFTYFPGHVGAGLSVLEPFLTRLIGADGSWEIGPDRGLVFDSDDAERFAVDRSGRSGGHPDPAAVAREARDAFTRVDEALGPLDTPRPPQTHRWDPFLEAMEKVLPDRAVDRFEIRRGP